MFPRASVTVRGNVRVSPLNDSVSRMLLGSSASEPSKLPMA